jgi:tetratricopeptide (TPR) repeat protein
MKITLLVGRAGARALLLLLALVVCLWPTTGDARAAQTNAPKTQTKKPKKHLPTPARGFKQYAKRDAADKLLTGAATRGTIAQGTDTAPALNPQAQASYDQGLTAYKTGRFADAAKAFERATREAPDWAEAQYALAQARLKRGQFEPAVVSFQQALTKQPDAGLRLWAYYGLGNAYAETEKFDEAAAAYREAIRLMPELSKPHYNLALTLVGAGRSQDALAEFKEAVRLNPNYVEARYNLGVLALDLGDRAEAERQQQQLQQLNSNYAAKLQALLRK